MVAGCGKAAAVYMKKDGESQEFDLLDSVIFSVFFSLLRKPGRLIGLSREARCGAGWE